MYGISRVLCIFWEIKKGKIAPAAVLSYLFYPLMGSCIQASLNRWMGAKLDDECMDITMVGAQQIGRSWGVGQKYANKE